MTSVSRAIRRHDWRAAFQILIEAGVAEEPAAQFVLWERRSAIDRNAPPAIAR